MPVILSFDLEGAQPGEHNRLQSMFERLGWENLGGSSYRYPKLGKRPRTEDWFNHVVPALMLFRAYALKSQTPIKKFSLDVQSSTGYLPVRNFGTAPAAGDDITYYEPRNPSFGLKNLKEWLDGVDYPY